MGCGASKKNSASKSEVQSGGENASQKHDHGQGECATSTGRKTMTSKKARAPSDGDVHRISGSPSEISSGVEAGKKWLDTDFPPNDDSLQLEDEVAGLVWVRPEAICENPQLVTDGFDNGDIVQGQLGSCWFLGALSVVATREDLMAIVIGKDQFPEKGVFSFRFYKFGRWIEVVIDDFIPATQRGPAFAQGKDPDELWVAYMEKAYAKLHGTFQAIVGGWVSDALVDLTGGVPDVIYFDDDDVKPKIASGALFDTLLGMYNSEEYLMGCAMSTSGTREADTGMGILQGHAYGILEVRRYGKLRMLRCRNPWGQTEWKGKYSDEDSSWWTAKRLSEFSHTLGDDGSFWIEYDDFVKQYNKIYLCRLLDPEEYKKAAYESRWEGKTAGGCINNKETWRNNPQYRLTVPEKTEVILSIQQPDSRIIDNAGKGVYIGMVVFEAPDGKKSRRYKPIHQTKIANMRELTITETLEKGTYNIMVFTFDAGEESAFVISAWSKSSIALESYQPGEKPLAGSVPPPSDTPIPISDDNAADDDADDDGSHHHQVSATTYEPDDNGEIGALAKKYLDQLGERYPMLKKIDSDMVASYVGKGEKMVKMGLKKFGFGGKK